MIVPHDEIRERVLKLYKDGGLPKGTSTGWPSVDQFYTVGTHQWTLVTGYPNSGKSEWLDALLVNLARDQGWRFVIFSPENWPLELHHSKLIEKYIGKPFTPGPTQRMDEDDLDHAEEWLKGKFLFAKPEQPTLDSILDEARDIRSQFNAFKLGVVIDPWNQLDHSRAPGFTETEYVSQALTRVLEWAREANNHLWLVAHPTKTFKDKDGKLPVPTPHDVSGSAHFWNKADNCITVWRDLAEGNQEVEVHVQKVRWKNIGKIGKATLNYDRVTGRYHEKPELKSIASYYD